MSRIGDLPIPIVSSVKLSMNGSEIGIEGPKGKLSQVLPQGISARIEGEQVIVARSDDSKPQRSLHGLSRSLLANAIQGVSKGFEKKLEIHGVGYTAELAGKNVNFKLGYSHPVVFAIPEGISVKVERNALTVSGFDRQAVGQVAANIRSLRPPDVYKQKGIRYAGETLRKKAGKAAGK